MAKRQNLLLQSQTFTSASWIKGNCSVAGAVVLAPDGTLSGIPVINTNGVGNVQRYVYQLEPASVPIGSCATISFYVKAGLYPYCVVGLDGAVHKYIFFTLVGAGAIGTIVGNGSFHGEIQNVGNGWYHCAVVVDRRDYISSQTAVYSAMSSSGNTWVEANVTDPLIYIWGAQYIAANHPGPYTPTTTEVVNTGNIKNIAQKKQNLLAYSQTFENAAWLKSNLTITDNQATAPDGMLTAARVNDSAALSKFFIPPTSYDVGVMRTYSFFAKAGTKSWMAIYINSNAGGSVYFDLVNAILGTVTTNANLLDYGIESIGNGWCRCWVVLRRSGAGFSERTFIANGDGGNSYVGDGNGTVFVWGGQSVLANHSGPYTPTTTAAVNTGNIKNIAQKKQNLLKYSEQFHGNLGWDGINVTAVADQGTAPDGTLTSDLMYPTTTGASRYFTQATVSTAPGTIMCASIYAKTAGMSWMQIYAPDVGNNAAWFDLTNGVIGTVTGGNGVTYTARMESVGNGWYRCSVSQKLTATVAPRTMVLLTDADGSVIATTNGTSGILVWGGQLVQANHPGPYTPTTTAAVNTGNIRNIAQKKQNLLLQSETFDSVSWGKVRSTIGPNAVANPIDGAITADALIEDAQNGAHYVSQTIPVKVVGAVYTTSFYVHPADKTWCYVSIGGAGTSQYYNLSGEGSLGTSGGAPINPTIRALPGGWYWVSLSTVATLGNSIFGSIYGATANNTASYQGVDGTTSLYIFGGQIVQANHSGPYTPTTTAAVNTGNIRNKITATRLESLTLGVQGFVDATNYLLAGVDTNLPGDVGGFFLSTSFYVPAVPGAGITYLHVSRLASTGWQLAANAAVINWSVWNAVGVPSNAPATTIDASAVGKVVLLTVVYDQVAGKIRMFRAGVQVGAGTPLASYALTGATARYSLGSTGGVAPFPCRHVGALYGTGIPQPADVLAHYNACKAANGMVEMGGGVTNVNLWDARDYTPSAGGIWVDRLSGIGLVQTGTLIRQDFAGVFE